MEPNKISKLILPYVRSWHFIGSMGAWIACIIVMAACKVPLQVRTGAGRRRRAASNTESARHTTAFWAFAAL